MKSITKDQNSQETKTLTSPPLSLQKIMTSASEGQNILSMT